MLETCIIVSMQTNISLNWDPPPPLNPRYGQGAGSAMLVLVWLLATIMHYTVSNQF